MIKAINKRLRFDEIDTLTDREKLAIEQLKKSLEDEFGKVELVLFGSKARGNFSDDSDVDILVFTDKEEIRRNAAKLSDLTFYVNFEYGTNLSCKIANNKKWEDPNYYTLPFPRNVREDAINLVL